MTTKTKTTRKAVAKKDILAVAIANADKSNAEIAKLMKSNPAAFSMLESSVKDESARMKTNLGVIRLKAGKKISQKCLEDIEAHPEIIEFKESFDIAEGIKKTLDPKTGEVKDTPVFSSPAMESMRDSKKVSLAAKANNDDTLVSETKVTIEKLDNRLDNASSHATAISQVARAIRIAKRAENIAQIEQELSAKNVTLRNVASLAERLGFTKTH